MNVLIEVAEIEKLALEFQNLTKDQGIIKRALYVGAGILADQIKANLEGVLSGNGTGDMLASFGISDMDANPAGAKVSIGFNGYDRRHRANAVKARALESGTSRQPKRPYIRPAISQTKDRVKMAIAEEIQKQINEKLK